jgi:hypothetical protein
MSYTSEAFVMDYAEPLPAASEFPLRRSKLLPLPFLLPTGVCFVSWLGGGIPSITDFGFVLLAGICVIYLAMEIIRFPRRYGIGGIVLFGGVLVWFCHDYFSQWFGYNFSSGISPFTPEVIARTACYYSLFVCMMTVGLLITRGQWLVKLILRAPEPSSSLVYLCVWLLLVLIGLLPFAFFTTDGFFTSLIYGAFGNWMGKYVNWTVGRTGNYNYSWGAYVGQVIAIGQFSSVFGIFYGIFVSRSIWIKAAVWSNWIYWMLYIFQLGRRGDVAALTIPAIGFLYIKLQMRAAQKSGRPRQSILAYAITGVLLIVTLFVVQYQGDFRDHGLNTTDISQVALFQSQGNLMFSEGLAGFARIPDHRPPFRDTIPGEGAILALPDTFVWFCVGPIPRALWIDKPVDPAMVWYNAMVTGGEGMEGTTASQGIVGHWYFRYGTIGMIEGAILIGWLMGITERVLQGSGDKPLGILYSLVLMAWLFRIYRNFYFQELYGWMIGAAAFALLVIILSPSAKPATN